MWKRTFITGCCVVVAARTLPQPVMLDSPPESGLQLSRPGALLWGSNKRRVVSADADVPFIKTPTRAPFLDGRLLRDMALSEDIGCAVLENGDVLQWQDGQQRVIAKKNISSVHISGQTVVALSKKSSKIYTWNADTQEAEPTCLKLPTLGWFEYIDTVETGSNHILARTTRGRVLSGSTNSPEKSRAQFGIASYSQFEKPPAVGELHLVKLLQDVHIAQIAAGENHSLARTKDGKLFVFGENVNGQIGIPFSYRTANIGAPTELSFGNRTQALSNPTTVTDIEAGGNVSYITTHGPEGRVIYSIGNGMTGQLGTGSFAHSQVQPLKIKKLNEMTEYSVQAKAMKPIDIVAWSIGGDHTFVTLKTVSEEIGGNNVLAWGWNDKGQLGNGKRSTVSQPTQMNIAEGEAFIPLQLFSKKNLRYMNDQGKMKSATVDQVIVAGDKCSGIFYK